MNHYADLAVWVLTAVVAAMGTILWWSIRNWIRGVNEKIAEIMAELKVVGNKNIGFEKDISRLEKLIDSHDKRLQGHSERMHEIEQKQAGCRNYKTT